MNETPDQGTPPALRTLFDQVATHFPGHTMQRVRLPDGRIRYTYASPGMRETFGLDPAAVVAEASASHDWIDPDDRPRFLAALERSADRLETFDQEVRVHGADGRRRWVRSISHPRRMSDGTVVWDGIAIDVTERRETEAALRRMLEMARKAEAAQSGLIELARRQPPGAMVEIERHLQQLSRLSPGARVHVEAIRAALATIARPPAPETEPAEPAGKTLTQRQREVFALLGRGRSNAAIAAELGIDAGTVKLHVAAIFKRLGLRNRTEAALLASKSLGSLPTQ